MIGKALILTFVFGLSGGYATPQDTPSPEEPDFFFLTGGPYTQAKHSPQVIWASRWLHSRNQAATVSELVDAGRVEFGVTDYLETDFEFGATRTTEALPGLTQTDTQFDGMMLGARYRILREDFAPITLTIGPQLLIPNRTDRPWETGYGYGLDLTAAKDWGGPVFAVASLNWRNTPGVRTERQGPELALQQLSYGFAFGMRPIEAVTESDSKHDLHLFAEVNCSKEDELVGDGKSTSTSVFFAPGVRYGFLNKRGILAEIGVSFPVGLNRDAPDRGTFLQLQIEMPGLF
jgi:hypothetical protein